MSVIRLRVDLANNTDAPYREGPGKCHGIQFSQWQILSFGILLTFMAPLNVLITVYL